jgi:hypothetical protein
MPLEHPHRIEEIEKYRGIPIFHLVYEGSVVIDRQAHQEELQIIDSIAAERFGLVICFRNLSIAREYSSEAQAEVYASPSMGGIRDRIVAVARYNPGSLTSMVRTMTSHLYLRQAFSAEFAPDLESALRVVRRSIDADRAARRDECG